MAFRPATNYYRATALFLTSTPTTWTIGHIFPSHAKVIHQRLGMGLGINTMEGRDAKHVTLAKFTHNTQLSLVTGGLKFLNMSMCHYFG